MDNFPRLRKRAASEGNDGEFERKQPPKELELYVVNRWSGVFNKNK